MTPKQVVTFVLSPGASVFYLIPVMLCVPELEAGGSHRIWKMTVLRKCGDTQHGREGFEASSWTWERESNFSSEGLNLSALQVYFKNVSFLFLVMCVLGELCI